MHLITQDFTRHSQFIDALLPSLPQVSGKAFELYADEAQGCGGWIVWQILGRYNLTVPFEVLTCSELTFSVLLDPLLWGSTVHCDVILF